MNKKGFTLLETLVAALILTVIGGAIAGVYIKEGALLAHTSHRLQALNYARSVTDGLVKISEGDDDESSGRWGGWWSLFFKIRNPRAELTPGYHDDRSNPEICDLPYSFFEDHLEARVFYEIKDMAVTERVSVRIVEVSVEWTETFPKREKKEEKLYAIVMYYPSWYSRYI